jgi:DNA-binding GntR family transcriptional regulator
MFAVTGGKMEDGSLAEMLSEAITLQKDSRDISRADFVYQTLGMAIQSGRFRGGERVREEEIALHLRVSRTPVREALRRLQSSGLLEMAPGRGLSVPVMNRRKVIELYEVRELLEGAAARLAAQYARDSDVALLRKLLAESVSAESDATNLARINRAFHNAIYDAAHNQYLLGTVREIYASMALLGATTFSMPGRSQAAATEHRTIVDAIVARKPDKAEQAARDHIQKAKRTRLEMLPTE